MQLRFQETSVLAMHTNDQSLQIQKIIKADLYSLQQISPEVTAAEGL